MKYSLLDLQSLRLDIKPWFKIFLYGDLGSGKTSFVRNILKNQFSVADNVTSPTYIHYKKYDPNIYHFDLYRLESYDDFVNIGWEEILESDDYISFIEWPEVLEKTYKPDIVITFDKVEWDEDSREIGIEVKNK
ncbi:MAG: hypothetical protein ACD_3C00043G0013 [uncultured bacterium (gcode 4)]|uniref:tRNA threonylcarbamoyladenosine biosynthesis protein TsaE n=1 Tax=uncultured bacterium (gcode 4) TaxID=1234023 RepID=K2GEB7_9BACT|nr:MAG: hypothetical protein ACD_3C00043G0013 [uncultured bacterium (gcode 4)]